MRIRGAEPRPALPGAESAEAAEDGSTPADDDHGGGGPSWFERGSLETSEPEPLGSAEPEPAEPRGPQGSEGSAA
jgi:hypothetical protein